MPKTDANQLIAIAAIALIVILFVLVMTGTIPAVVAIILTVVIGQGARIARTRANRP